VRIRVGEGWGLFVLLLLYEALVGAGDMLTSDAEIRLLPFSALGPFAASALFSFRQTIAVCALFLAFVSVDYSYVTDVSATQHTVIIVSSAVLCVLALGVCWVRLGREERMRRLALTAEAAQRLLLRPLPLRTGDVAVNGFYVAAERESLVGGDLYEGLPTPHGTRVVIGDVRGKGLPAIGGSAAVLTAFREGAYQEATIVKVAERMEKGLERYGYTAASDPRERFVTALIIETAGPDTYRLVDCGHEPPFVITRGAVAEVQIDDPGLPLGMGDLTDEPRRAQEVKVPTGGRLLACTDGVSEARNPAGEFYPLAERLADFRDLPTDQLLERIRKDLVAHTHGSLSDDVALLVVQR
jgi:serine phosphatase RsbU (regulator of sigma subunit)